MINISGWWWLEPWNFMTFHIYMYWEFHDPNWRFVIFFIGVGIPTTKQFFMNISDCNWAWVCLKNRCKKPSHGNLNGENDDLHPPPASGSSLLEASDSWLPAETCDSWLVMFTPELFSDRLLDDLQLSKFIGLSIFIGWSRFSQCSWIPWIYTTE